MNGFSHFKTRFLLIGSVLAVQLAIITPRAYASATGAEPVAAFSVSVSGTAGPVSIGKDDLTIPAGFLWHTITGDGRKIENEFAWYQPNAIGLLRNKPCNWRIDFVYRENGHEYMRERGKVVHECTGLLKVAAAHARPKTLPRFGTACAQLWSNGTSLATQCHNITR